MISISFRQKRILCQLVSDCSRLLNCLCRKQSEKYLAKWDRGFNVLNLAKLHQKLKSAHIACKFSKDQVLSCTDIIIRFFKMMIIHDIFLA